MPLLQITCLGVYKWNGDNNEPACLGAGQDLTSFGYFQRSTVKEMLLFVSRTIVKRTQPGQRQSVEHNGAVPRGRGPVCAFAPTACSTQGASRVPICHACRPRCKLTRRARVAGHRIHSARGQPRRAGNNHVCRPGVPRAGRLWGAATGACVDTASCSVCWPSYALTRSADGRRGVPNGRAVAQRGWGQHRV